MQPVYHRLPVVDAGGMELHLPICDIGPGAPRLCVVAGIHGDEPSPLVLVDRLVVALREREMRAAVRVVAAANMPALLQRSRWSSWDDEDMNRVGDGEGGPALTRRLAAAVVAACEGCTLAVNLHNFVMRTPLLAIQPPGQDADRRSRHDAYIAALDPHVVWVFGDGPDDVRTFGSSIDAAIERRGTDVLAVEMSDLPELDEPLLARGIAGLLRLAAHLGCIDDQERAPKRNRVYVRRRLVRAPGAGIFEPIAALGGQVAEDEVVGELIPLERPGARVPVRSPERGWLIQRLGRRFVRPGDMIFTVGRSV
ncbi:MAG: succinylglutamate desuccinylase/aspartoacylase family protein [Deltaproteobacteria bacterium]|nr:succinylglutamate desuccinylase/aspartoacylase family protein [Deltaproteobacteria bacterium]